jgi:hypothetical protein
MATAQKFNADGRGNGFPFCLLKTNKLNDIDAGATFGDTELTLAQLMHIYWNLHSISYSVTKPDTSDEGQESNEITYSGEYVAIVPPNDGTPAEPIDRLCKSVFLVDSSERSISRPAFYFNENNPDLYRLGGVEIFTEAETFDLFFGFWRGYLLENFGGNDFDILVVGFDPSKLDWSNVVNKPRFKSGPIPIDWGEEETFNLWYIINEDWILDYIDLVFYTYD